MTAPSPAVVAGNVYDKYGSTHPIARRLQHGFERAMDAVLDHAGAPRRILEVGCGEGQVLARLARRFPNAELLGTDVSADIVAEAHARHPGLCFDVRSVYDVAALGRFDLVVACEVFEHLDDPPRALAAIASVSGGVFASVPREPLWRVLNVTRGRYWSALGNTPGHVQHWSRAAFLEFLATRLDVQAVRTPTPWTMAFGRPREAA